MTITERSETNDAGESVSLAPPVVRNSRRKVYATGDRPDLRVPFTEVRLADAPDGTTNSPVRLYDTSGPGSEPTVGLGPVRLSWILGRGDVEPIVGRTAEIRATAGVPPVGPRVAREALVSWHGTDEAREVLRAKAGRNVTQMHYARRGEITPEMEFVALREGMPAEFVRDEVAAGRAIIPPTSTTPRREPMIIGKALPGEDQRQHRQLGGDLVDRGGGGEDDLGHPLGRRHGHGPVHRARHPRPPASGSCATARCRSAPCPSTRPWRRSAAARRISPGSSTATRSSSRPSRASTTSPSTPASCCATCR